MRRGRAGRGYSASRTPDCGSLGGPPQDHEQPLLFENLCSPNVAITSIFHTTHERGAGWHGEGSSTSLRPPTTDRYCVSPGLVHRRLRRLECLDDLKSVAPIRQWALSCFDAVCEVLTL